MDELDRLLWKKAVELSAREGRPRCCTVGYTPGYVLRGGSQLKNAIYGCKVAFVMFFGKTCPYCQMFDPIFRQVGERYRDFANFVKADIEEFYQLAASLGIMGTPATVAFVDGRPVEVAPGFMTAPQFRAFVEAVLKYASCK
ncbi:thioredoxin family protein [Pyrobaculum aerophilum]|nr:thioredoxin family protein [Pyrobaculum aerophilum]